MAEGDAMPMDGKVRLLNARGGSAAKITYAKLFSDEMIAPGVTRPDWIAMLEEYDQAFAQIERRLGLEPRPTGPTVEQVEPFYNPPGWE